MSAASAWETGTKRRRGKLREAESVVMGFRKHLDLLGAVELPIPVERAWRVGRLPGKHWDPFDRVRAAQALIEGLGILTNDPTRRFRCDGSLVIGRDSF